MAKHGRLRSKVKIEGLEELQRKLGRLPDAVSNPVLREAVADGAEIVRAEAETRAPVGPTGRLKRGMTTLVSAGTPEVAQARVGPSADAFYGMWVEKGTKKMAAQPFLRPALDSKRKQVVEAVKAKLVAALRREVAGG